MIRNNKLPLAVFAVISLLSASHAAEISPESELKKNQGHPPLTKPSITAGCSRQACIMRGGYGVLANGLRATLRGQVEMHDHPGATVDILPRAAMATGKHYQRDFLSIKTPKTKVESVMLEQIPPVKHYDHGGTLEFDYGYMSKFIEHARIAVRPGSGRIIIHVAADVQHKNSSKEVENIQRGNPFIFFLNDKLIDEMNKAIPSGKSPTNPLLSETISFYTAKLDKAFIDAHLPKQAVSLSRQAYAFSFAKPWNLKQGQDKMHDSYEAILKLYGLFEGKERMANYLFQHGFHNIKAEWLERGEHQYNPSSGFFLTGVADDVSDIIEKVTSFGPAVTLTIMGYAQGG